MSAVQLKGRAMKKPAIGDWFAMSCVDDLYQIEDEEELQAVRNYIAEGFMPAKNVWSNRAEALVALGKPPEQQGEKP